MYEYLNKINMFSKVVANKKAYYYYYYFTVEFHFVVMDGIL